ncbi:MAG: carbon dioxide concentrating mechanism protein CcmL [bacterium]|nr:MAG: carbon dioxide concentrating mechanism protein CcmL [bacterium]
MLLGKVIGRLVATQKLSAFTGIKFLVVQPIDEDRKEINEIIVACDTVQAGEGDVIFYETGREATFPLPDRMNPSDATITAIVDHINNDE